MGIILASSAAEQDSMKQRILTTHHSHNMPLGEFYFRLASLFYFCCTAVLVCQWKLYPFCYCYLLHGMCTQMNGLSALAHLDFWCFQIYEGWLLIWKDL